MHNLGKAVLGTFTAIALGTPALAITTYSPPVRSSEGDNLGCFVQNLSNGSVEVVSEINNGLNTIVDSQTLAVPAGQVLQLARTSDAVFGAYCIFTFDGSPSEVRGFVSLQDAGGSNTRLLYPAEPIDESLPVQLGQTTVSPPVRSSEGDNLGCFVQNLGANPVQVVSEINNGLNTIVDSQTLTVPAGQALLLARTSTAVFGGYCTFRFDDNPTRVRGYISLQDAGGSNTRLLFPASAPVAPAPPPTPTATAAPDATATPTAPTGGCCGDCDGSGEVTINELITAVNNALNTCPAP